MTLHDEIKAEFDSGQLHSPEPMKAFWGEQVCALLHYHAPLPVMLEYHHQKPVFLQNKLYGKIVYGPSLWVCSNCHDAIHAQLYWLLGMHQKPNHMGLAARYEAMRTYNWFISELKVRFPDEVNLFVPKGA